jgi:hypothetical protein
MRATYAVCVSQFIKCTPGIVVMDLLVNPEKWKGIANQISGAHLLDFFYFTYAIIIDVNLFSKGFYSSKSNWII